MGAHIMSSSSQEAIVDPSLRPLPRQPMPPSRRRVGFALLGVGVTVFLVGAFVSFGEWLFAIGSTIMIAGAFVLGPFRYRWDKPDEMRKLYGQREV